ncbi:MAG: hypothetical protein K6G55_07510 [Selenomonadaceae bacterium]|nr:hypothetical protein [Selenomonadaceae bacterium]
MLCGYLRTIKNYLRTPKARHDWLDYLRALLIITFIAAIIMLIFNSL